MTAIAKVAANPEFQAKMKAGYTPMRFLPPDEFAVVLQQRGRLPCALAGAALGREVGLRSWGTRRSRVLVPQQARGKPDK